MRTPSGFYQTQISLCARMAAEAGLANQRDMFLRSQAAWQELADSEARAQADKLQRLPA